ncbi:MAG: DMT family transporter [Capsulimonadales bacterium]|nr:DMT family transporter [Capsulimonadales bacterium]
MTESDSHDREATNRSDSEPPPVTPPSEPSASDPRPLPPNPYSGFLILLSCVAIWGVNAVAFKICTRPPTGTGFDPLFLTGLRFVVVAPCMALLVGLKQPKSLFLPPGDWKRYLLFGFVAIVLAETLQPLALRFTSVANLTLLSHGTISLFTAFWALLFFKQRITRAGWVGAVVAMFGVALVAANGSQGGFRLDADSLKGDAIALFRSFEHSLYLLALSWWLRMRPTLQVSLFNCVFGALWLLPYVVYRSIGFPWEDVPRYVWGWLLWTIFPTTLYGFLAWNWAMRRVGALAATNTFYLMPVSAAVAARVLLGEPVTPGQGLGGLVILVGILLLRWETLVEAGVIRGRPEIRWRRRDDNE